MTILRFIISAGIAFGGTLLLVLLQIFRYRKITEHPWKDVFSHKPTMIVYVILRMLVIFSLVRGAFRHDIESVMYCALALVLFCLPMILESRFDVEFSPTMEVIILLFIYAAEILGEVESYYVKVPGWDTALHTMNGFLCAAIGFCLFDMLNRSEDVNIHLSPFFMALVAFCFSMTVGVLWEFVEFAADQFLHMDMQKDFLVTTFQSVNLDATMSNIAVQVKDIVRTVITTGDGTTYVIEGGYLDIGIKDTMKDLLVNCVGALIFCAIGFLGLRAEKQGRIARTFIPLVKKPRDLILDKNEEKTEKGHDR